MKSALRFLELKMFPISKTWFLLLNLDEDTDDIYCELSLPETISKDGYITSWRERILLLPIYTGPGATSEADDSGFGRDRSRHSAAWRA